MTLSFSCEQGEHDHCLRPTCTCYCGHQARAARHARYDEDPLPAAPPRLTRADRRPDLDIEMLVHAYRVERLSLEAVGARYGATADTVKRRLVAAGITIRSRGRQRGR